MTYSFRSITCCMVVMCSSLLNACTAESWKHGAYEGLYQNECYRRSGTPNCDQDHKPYEAYEKEREKALSKESR